MKAREFFQLLTSLPTDTSFYQEFLGETSMPFQRSTAGFIFAITISAFLGSGLPCCWADDCCAGCRVMSSDPYVSAASPFGTLSHMELARSRCYFAGHCCDRTDHTLTVSNSPMHMLAMHMVPITSHRFESAAVVPSSRVSHSERGHPPPLGGESLVQIKCSLLS
jgi:hypothetical protein